MSAAVASEPAVDLLDLYRRMVLIRRFEEVVERVYQQGAIAGGTHLYKGQEAVAVGVTAALRPSDAVTYTYRSHGVALARGMSATVALAEMMGRAIGSNRGKGGSMHLKDIELGLHGAFAIVGAGLPVAVGLGRAAQLRGVGDVSVTFFGDGATNHGSFHEAMNMAAALDVPVVFVCENNLYGEYTPIEVTTRVSDLAVRADGYGMRRRIVFGNDVVSVLDATRDAVRHGRDGGGPTFLEFKTYRQSGHGAMDPGSYRPVEEVASWLARDPLVIAREHLRVRGLADRDGLDRIDTEVTALLDTALAEATAAPMPEPDEVTTDVYA